MSSVIFNREKFRELLLYIAQQTEDDPWFGDTHMNKVLYWADFDSYSQLGRPITGARYSKLPYGPGAKPLLPIRDELSAEGSLSIDEPPPGTRKARKTHAKRQPNISLFSPEELALVNATIERLQRMTASRASDVSHDEPGWKLVDLYDDIPYQTALISKDPPPAHTVSRARDRAAQIGW